MDNYLIFTLFVLLFPIIRGIHYFNCATVPSCHCYSSSITLLDDDVDTELQCPLGTFYNGTSLSIHIKKRNIEIICSFFYDLSYLPKITEGTSEVNQVEIIECPLPVNNFAEIGRNFGLETTRIKSLTFTNTLESEKLTKHFFIGFENITELNLNSDNLSSLNGTLDFLVNLKSLLLDENKLSLEKCNFDKLINLEELHLSRNRIEVIPKGIFANLIKLKWLYLSVNLIKELNSANFNDTTELVLLELGNNKINSIAENTFSTLKQLKYLNLQANSIQSFPKNLFEANKNLTNLRLSHNLVASLPGTIFRGLNKLEELLLTNLSLKELPSELFSDLNRLNKLDLSHNLLRTLQIGIFHKLINLIELNLSQNRILELPYNLLILPTLKILKMEDNELGAVEAKDLSQLDSLEEIYFKNNKIVGQSNFNFEILGSNPTVRKIDFSNNLIENVEDVITINTHPFLEEADFSRNKITKIALDQFQSILNDSGKRLELNLNSNNISMIDFSRLKALLSINEEVIQTVIDLGNNSINCNCNYDLFLFKKNMFSDSKVYNMFKLNLGNLVCQEPKNTSFVNLQLQNIQCPQNENEATCPTNCDCFYRFFDLAFVIDCSNRNFVHYPSILNITSDKIIEKIVLNLSHNNFTSGPNQLQNVDFSNLTSLNLSANQITNFSWIPPSLEHLELNENRIESLDQEIFAQFNSRPLQIRMGQNPWKCGCGIETFTKFLQDHHAKVDADHIFCDADFSNKNKRISSLKLADVCLDLTIPIIITFLGLLLFIATLVALYLFYKQEVKVWLFAKGIFLFWVTEEEIDKDKIYDAFISYSHKDEDFVVENLLPMLESGPNPYKLCVHIRNWIPGEFITKQITNSVCDSRRTIVVLSESFLESVWGKMEFRTAHTQAMKEGRARVIVILLEKLKVNKLDMDNELKSYLSTNTYLEWGDPYFWNKLKYALPHRHTLQSNKKSGQKFANVMSSIDSVFKKPVKQLDSVENPESTPPVTLDNVVVPKNLDFFHTDAATDSKQTDNVRKEVENNEKLIHA